MKKSLLFAAALTLAITANAQVARNAGTATQSKAVATQQMKNAKIDHRSAEHATAAFAPRAKKAVPTNSAYYLRPKGTMYCNWNKEGSGFIMPFVNSKPYDEVTWRNMSTATGNPAWGYWLYSIEAGARDSLTSNERDLTVRYGYEYEDVPYLKMGNVGPYTLSGYRVNRTTGAIEGEANSGVAAVPNSQEIYSDFETNMLASAHYYGSSNRFGTEAYGWIYYSGAPGPDYDPEAPDPDRSGHWFGKNYGDWNVFGCGFEKPISPYVLNKIYFWVTALEVSEDCELEARVYRVGDELPAYSDTTAAQIDPGMLNEENLIATGRTTLTTDMNEDGSPILEFTLYETDPELGIEYETTPQINDAIVILIVGMDQEAIKSISGLVTTDEEDEGVGEVTYMGAQQDGVITRCVGINNFFTSGQLKVGSSIMLDVTRPFITFNYTFEEGTYTFPNAGGQLAYNLGGETIEGISFFAYSPKADWVVTDVNGNDVPDWLTITLEDEEESGEWTGVVNAHVTAAALPNGLDGRRAKVRFAINGGYIDYLFIQGVDPGEPEPGVRGDVTGDGKVDVDDLNAIINMMLGKADKTPEADVTGDGNVDVDDMNVIINIMLGKDNG
ncbi:MAG: dockerin type I repeat-containing protein [Muribaculaceae bacterium]|nr:dockerin type I repeat-containing protein [Muribaculaceae bacterium]